MKTVIVDDDPMALKLLQRQFERLGRPTPAIFERADAALFEIEHGEQAVELVICDLQMPDTDGIELLRRLVDLEFAGSVLLISGEDLRLLRSAERLAQAHRLRVLGALQKPIANEALQELLQRAEAEHADIGRSALAISAQDLRFAIWGGDEMLTWYQPLVDLRTQQVVAIEAVPRWQHPLHGLLGPADFLPLAESNGLSGGLTERMLDNALSALKRWRGDGHDLQLTVNVAAGNLRTLEFPDAVVDALRRNVIAPALLTLEVGERHLLAEPPAILDTLTRLHLKRIRISVDGFGASRTALEQLQELPIARIKLAATLVHGTGDDPALRSIFDLSLGIARELGLETAADGVDDVDDWAATRDAGCHLAQGLAVAPAMSAIQFDDWLHRWPAQAAAMGSRR